MRILHKEKSGFTMVELVFVIVILGIVASIGSTIIAQLFENYIVQRAMHRVSLKTELAANQIANRLSYAIPSSIIVHNDENNSNFQLLRDVATGYSDTTPQTLEWIGYDNDGFTATARESGWSGYCDTSLASTTGTNIRTPGSALAFEDTLIKNLSGNTKSLANTALLFSTDGDIFSSTPNVYQNATCYGFRTVPASYCIHRIANRKGTINLTLDNALANNNLISRHYKLAWSAYALVPINITNNTLFDLALYYNYQPWDGSQFPNANSALIIKNVTSFKYALQGNTIRFKLCATERIGDSNTTNISVCKEKVVIR